MEVQINRSFDSGCGRLEERSYCLLVTFRQRAELNTNKGEKCLFVVGCALAKKLKHRRVGRKKIEFTHVIINCNSVRECFTFLLGQDLQAL
jgi:hypothetical protein